MASLEPQTAPVTDTTCGGHMKVLKGAETPAKVTHDHLRLLLGLPPAPPPYLPPAPAPPPASERPPVVSDLSYGRMLQGVSESLFNWFLRSLFFSVLALCAIRLIFELLVTGAHYCCNADPGFQVWWSTFLLLAFLPVLVVFVQHLVRHAPMKSIYALPHHV